MNVQTNLNRLKWNIRLNCVLVPACSQHVFRAPPFLAQYLSCQYGTADLTEHPIGQLVSGLSFFQS